MKRQLFMPPLLLIIGIFTVIFLTYLIVYRPMNEDLNDQTYENYCIVSSQKELRIEQYIDRSIEGAVSLSSRTMIRNAIQDYHDGEMTFSALSDYTSSRYADGVNALGNVVSATRVVDGRIVTQVGEPMQDGGYGHLDGISDVTFTVMQQDEGFFIKVVSPIVNDQTIIGYDIVTYTMTELIATLNEGDADLRFINASSQAEMLNDADILKDRTSYTLALKDGEVTYISEGIQDSDNHFIAISISQAVLESDIQALTSRSLAWMVFLIVTSFIVVATLSMRHISSELKKEKFERKYFQKRANKDALTGAYTRHYFEYWLTRIKNEFDESMHPIAVVMSDINGFKKFNDTYGHQAGDQALKDVTGIFEASIRKDDLFIRYGGDEFLFVFTQCDEALCEKIMKRIDSEIQGLYASKNLSLAYGYVVVEHSEEIPDSIEIADQKMYEHKRKIED